MAVVCKNPKTVNSPFKRVKGGSDVLEIFVDGDLYDSAMALSDPSYVAPIGGSSTQIISNPYGSAVDFDYGDVIDSVTENGRPSKSYGTSSPTLTFAGKDGEYQTDFWGYIIAGLQEKGCPFRARIRKPVTGASCTFDAQAFANGHCCASAYIGDYKIIGICEGYVSRGAGDALTIEGAYLTKMVALNGNKTSGETYDFVDTSILPFLDCGADFFLCGTNFTENGGRAYLANTLRALPVNTAISNWKNTSNEVLLSQNLVASQPTISYESCGTSTPLRGVKFDGVDDYLKGNESLGGATQAKTLIISYRKDSANFPLFSKIVGGTSPSNSIVIEGTDLVITNSAGGSITASLPIQSSCAEHNLIAVTYDPSNVVNRYKVYALNAGLITTAASTSDFDLGTFFVGVGIVTGGTTQTFAEGVVYDVITAPYAMTSTEISDLFDTLSLKLS